jgi:hypothetical protein
VLRKCKGMKEPQNWTEGVLGVRLIRVLRNFFHKVCPIGIFWHNFDKVIFVSFDKVSFNIFYFLFLCGSDRSKLEQFSTISFQVFNIQ